MNWTWPVPNKDDEHEFALLDGCPLRPAGTGARLSAQEIASTLTDPSADG